MFHYEDVFYMTQPNKSITITIDIFYIQHHLLILNIVSISDCIINRFPFIFIFITEP
jgi:hypothetical protein